MADVTITPAHRSRLREACRSAGWPCRDALELELLAENLQHIRARRDAHELLVERVARETTRAGRIAWRGSSLRAKVAEAWALAMPDVFSIRHTSVEAYLEPVVHEIKVNRADLLSDLRSARKRAAYLQLGSECGCVIRAGIAGPAEIPGECGVLVACGGRSASRAPRRSGRCGCPSACGWRSPGPRPWNGGGSKTRRANSATLTGSRPTPDPDAPRARRHRRHRARHGRP